MNQYECAQCGTKFTRTKRVGAAPKYCSARCKNNAYGRSLSPAPGEPRQVTCKECGVEFTGYGSKAAFCSKECRRAAFVRGNGINPNVAREVTCPTCGTEFTATYSVQKYCSMRCGRVASGALSSVPRATNCAICDASIAQHSRGQRRVYCSRSCSEKARQIKRAGASAGRAKPSVKTCPRCQTEFKPSRRGTVYCSRACSQAESRKRRIAEGKCGKCSQPVPEGYKASACPTCLAKRRAEIDESLGRTPEERAALDALRPLTEYEELLREQEEIAREAKRREKSIASFAKMMGRWPRTPTELLDPRKEPLTPREKLAAGIGFRQQIRQLLGVKKGSESDPFTLRGVPRV